MTEGKKNLRLRGENIKCTEIASSFFFSSFFFIIHRPLSCPSPVTVTDLLADSVSQLWWWCERLPIIIAANRIEKTERKKRLPLIAADKIKQKEKTEKTIASVD